MFILAIIDYSIQLIKGFSRHPTTSNRTTLATTIITTTMMSNSFLLTKPTINLTESIKNISLTREVINQYEINKIHGVLFVNSSKERTERKMKYLKRGFARRSTKFI